MPNIESGLGLPDCCEVCTAGAAIGILPKIESADSVGHLSAILDAADGAMVARGDLGAELPVQEVSSHRCSSDACCIHVNLCQTCSKRLGKPELPVQAPTPLLCCVHVNLSQMCLKTLGKPELPVQVVSSHTAAPEMLVAPMSMCFQSCWRQC